MGCILISMPRYEDAGHIQRIVSGSGFWEQSYICESGNEMLRCAEDRDVSLVICTKRLPDMGYEELSTYLPASVNMLLLTKDAGLEPFSSNIIKLLMPFRSDDLIDTLRMLIPGSFSSGRRSRPQKPKPQRSEEEQKLIEKAKVTLMDRNGMTEPEAFRYIQKTSMDMGRTMIESAQMILMLNSE